MFNRRMLVALVACLAISASSAMAGAKKGQKVVVENNTGVQVYAFVGPTTAQIQAGTADAFDSQGNLDSAKLIAAFNKLGGKPVGPKGTADFAKDVGTYPATVIALDGSSRGNQESAKLEKGKDTKVTFTALVPLPGF